MKERDTLVAGVRAADRRLLAKAITLAESTRPDHQSLAREVMTELLPSTGKALRMGITGSPGVGKSTLIEALGLRLIEEGHRVAVLAVDPSSSITGGSVLGDKTRMNELSRNDRAFIRPSPASGALGGVAAHTREAMLFVEAAGFDVVIIETVGVGQSETDVANLTDVFVLMQLPNAGDDLQAIKKGVMEVADLVAINKADLDGAAATRAEAQITSALRVFGFHGRGDKTVERWQTRVMRMSALSRDGIAAFWDHVEAFHRIGRANGDFGARRRRQATAWLWDIVHAGLQGEFRAHPAVREVLEATLADVAAAKVAAPAAAHALLDRFGAMRGPGSEKT